MHVKVSFIEFPVKLYYKKYGSLASIFLENFARSCTKTCTYLVSFALKTKLTRKLPCNLFLARLVQDFNILQEKLCFKCKTYKICARLNSGKSCKKNNLQDLITYFLKNGSDVNVWHIEIKIVENFDMPMHAPHVEIPPQLPWTLASVIILCCLTSIHYHLYILYIRVYNKIFDLGT